jgi:large subunit ribosomal protein L4
MPQLTIRTTTGKTAGKINLPDRLFAAKVNPPLMAQAIRVHLANQRQSPAKTKTRSQVSLAKHKIWRQKGTGRARHGSRNAPIFVKGGIAHGPTGRENYQLKLSRRLRLAALASALTSKHRSQQVLVIKDLQDLKPKTKSAVQTLTRLKLQGQKVTFILPQPLPSLTLATRNLPQVATILAHTLNPYQVLPESITTLRDTFLKRPVKTGSSAKPASVKTPAVRTSAKKSPSSTQSRVSAPKKAPPKKTSDQKSPTRASKSPAKKTSTGTTHRRTQTAKAKATSRIKSATPTKKTAPRKTTA